MQKGFHKSSEVKARAKYYKKLCYGLFLQLSLKPDRAAVSRSPFALDHGLPKNGSGLTYLTMSKYGQGDPGEEIFEVFKPSFKKPFGCFNCFQH